MTAHYGSHHATISAFWAGGGRKAAGTRAQSVKPPIQEVFSLEEIVEFQPENTNQVRIWDNPAIGAHIRTIEKEGEPWFVAADVCRALDVANPRDAVARLDEDERGVASTDTPGGPQQVTTISEAGLYALVLGSRKPEAKAFKRWITHEVLPEIRRTGGYSLAIPRTFADALQLAADQQRIIEDQRGALAEAQTAVEFRDRYVQAKTSQPIRAVAKILGIREREFVAALESRRIMYRLGGDLVPFAEHLDTGRFEVKVGEEHGHAFRQARFTPAGIAWIAGKVTTGTLVPVAGVAEWK